MLLPCRWQVVVHRCPHLVWQANAAWLLCHRRRCAPGCVPCEPILAAMGAVTVWLSLAVLCFIAISLSGAVKTAVRSEGRSRVVTVWRKVSWRHVFPVPFVVAAVALAASWLSKLPLLSFGWWSALGGEGNPIMGVTETTSGTVWESIVPLAFMALFVPALPLLAYSEERGFRTGAECWSWGRRVVRTVQFGLIHTVAGLSIAVGLALSLGGAYFMFWYLRAFARTQSRDEATLESTAAHTAYNGMLVALFVTYLIATAV